jgi:hypothetical protein
MTAKQNSLLERLMEKVDATHDSLITHLAEEKQQYTHLCSGIEEAVTHAKCTNGKIAEISAWREQIKGGAKAGFFFGTLIVLPFVYWMVATINNIPHLIQEALAVYESPK